MSIYIRVKILQRITMFKKLPTINKLCDVIYINFRVYWKSIIIALPPIDPKKPLWKSTIYRKLFIFTAIMHAQLYWTVCVSGMVADLM